MTQVEFGREFIRLATAYRGRFVLNVTDSKEIKNEVMATWYEHFKDFDVEIFASAISNYIETQNYPPTVSTLLQSCLDFERIRNRHKVQNKDRAVVLKDDESNGEEFDRDRETHPFEKGWRINDDGYWIQIGV